MKIKALLSLLATTILLASTSVQAGGGGGTAHNTYSGRAIAVKATVAGINVAVADTGELPSSGGFIEKNLDLLDLDLGLLGLNLPLALPTITADLLHTATYGGGSLAEVAFLDLPIAGVLNLTAEVINATTNVNCVAGMSQSPVGSSTITNLVINGLPVTVTGNPNQVVLNKSVLGLKVKAVLNEQAKTKTAKTAAITVNALHVTVTDLLLGLVTLDVIVSSAKSGITCG